MRRFGVKMIHFGHDMDYSPSNRIFMHIFLDKIWHVIVEYHEVMAVHSHMPERKRWGNICSARYCRVDDLNRQFVEDIDQHDSAAAKTRRNPTNKFRARNILLVNCIVANAPRFFTKYRWVCDEAAIKKRGAIAFYWSNGNDVLGRGGACGCGTFPVFWPLREACLMVCGTFWKQTYVLKNL